jgi:hypothetical protein
VGAGSTAATGLRRTEVGDGLLANWRGLEFQNWGLVEMRNCELSNRGLLGVVGTYLGFWGAGVTAIPRVVGFYEIRLHPQLHEGGGGVYTPRPTVPLPHRTIWV